MPANVHTKDHCLKHLSFDYFVQSVVLYVQFASVIYCSTLEVSHHWPLSYKLTTCKDSDRGSTKDYIFMKLIDSALALMVDTHSFVLEQTSLACSYWTITNRSIILHYFLKKVSQLEEATRSLNHTTKAPLRQKIHLLMSKMGGRYNAK